MSKKPIEEPKENPKKPNKFLLKIYSILSNSNNSSVISWSDSGETFTIKDVSEFTKYLLPKYFKHHKLASFIRQLNMYDFSKCKNSEFCYSHPLFRKGKRGELKKIRRKLSEKKVEFPQTEMTQKFKHIKAKQKNLKLQIDELVMDCREVARSNQVLLDQIQESKTKQQSIFTVLMKFSERFEQIPLFLRLFCESFEKQIENPVPVPLSHRMLTSHSYSKSDRP